MSNIVKHKVGNNNKPNIYDKEYILYVLKTDIYINKLLSKGILFEKKLIIAICDYLKDTDVFIDVGCNIGNLSLVISRKLTNGFVYGFEAQHMMYKIIKKNIKANHFDNIKIFNLAVGDENKMMHMSSHITDGPNTNKKINYKSNDEFNFSGLSLGEDGEEVKMITLDTHKFDKNYISRLKVIKVDVEGAEPMVFYGAQQLIKTYKPVIVFEQNQKIIPVKVSNEVKKFNIFEFCYNLGYSKLYQIPYDNFMLVHPDHKKYSNNLSFQKTSTINQYIKDFEFVDKYEIYNI